MAEFRNEALLRVRPLRQAFEDLVAKYTALHQRHPERPLLARMIRQLALELALRDG